MMKTEQGNTGKARCTSTYNKLELWDLLEYINIEKKEALKTVSCKENIPTCIHTSKMYFAGPWFNDKSKAFYDAILEIAKICDCISDYDIFFPRCQVNETPFNAFMKNVGNIQNADMVVAFVDDKDVGTAWEIGMAYSLNKKIVLIGLDETTFLSHTNVMLAFTGECITLKEFAKLLVGKTYKTVKIKNEWEGIE